VFFCRAPRFTAFDMVDASSPYALQKSACLYSMSSTIRAEKLKSYKLSMKTLKKVEQSKNKAGIF
jgi:hypothetical protein